MKHSIFSKTKRAIFAIALAGGLIFAVIIFAANIYIRHNSPGWEELFIWLRSLPLLFFLIFLRALHITTNVDKWNEVLYWVAVSLTDGIAFGLFLLLIGLIWRHIADDSQRL
jgi:hypothetical protein